MVEFQPQPQRPGLKEDQFFHIREYSRLGCTISSFYCIISSKFRHVLYFCLYGYSLLDLHTLYQQESQSNTAGPFNLQGVTTTGQLHSLRRAPGTGLAPPSTHHVPHWRADRMDWCDLSHHFPQPLKSYSYQSSLQHHHPSSLEFLGYQCKICEEKRWVKAAGYISPAPEPIKKTHVLHIHCLHFVKSLLSD